MEATQSIEILGSFLIPELKEFPEEINVHDALSAGDKTYVQVTAIKGICSESPLSEEKVGKRNLSRTQN